MNRSICVALVATVLAISVSACGDQPAPDASMSSSQGGDDADSSALGLGSALINSAAQFAAARADDALIAAAMRDVQGTDPVLVRIDQAGGKRTAIVLPGAGRSYNLIGVGRRFPKLVKLEGSTVTVGVPIVAVRSTLVTDSRIGEIRLSSGPSGHAFLAANRGRLNLAGAVGQKQRISSFDTTTAQPDLDPTNGRAYITVRGGAMSFTDVQAQHLGFNDGVTSGVSWMGTEAYPATGGAVRSEFTSGRFGAYSSGALGLEITASRFANNEIYGFDPHSSTHRTVVDDSDAHGNGRHGFIFSKDCNDNVVRNSRSFSNGGVGFFIDDGNPRRSGIQSSNRNVIEGATARNNGSAGFVIEGGSQNEVRQSSSVGGRLGVVVREQATKSRLADVAVEHVSRVGIELAGGSEQTVIEASKVSAPVGLSVGNSTGNTVSGLEVTSTVTGIRLSAVGVATFNDSSVAGAGGAAVSVARSATAIPGVSDVGWVTTTDPPWRVRVIDFVLHPMGATAWLMIVCVPLAAWLMTKNRRRRGHDRLRSVN